MQRNTKFFKQIIVLFLLISMSSCKLTEQMAKRQIGRIMVEFPSVLALPCATMFPPIVSEKERIKIVKGDTVINTDTVIVDCADEKNIGQKIKIEKVEKVIIDTVFFEKIKTVENKAKVEVLEQEKSKESKKTNFYKYLFLLMSFCSIVLLIKKRV